MKQFPIGVGIAHPIHLVVQLSGHLSGLWSFGVTSPAQRRRRPVRLNISPANAQMFFDTTLRLVWVALYQRLYHGYMVLCNVGKV